MFPVGITVEDNFGQRVPIDQKIVNVIAGKFIYKKVGNQLENSIIPIFLGPCKKEDFPNLDDDSIKILNLSSLWCIENTYINFKKVQEVIADARELSNAIILGFFILS